jgi:hypothetical protein
MTIFKFRKKKKKKIGTDTVPVPGIDFLWVGGLG